MQLEAQSRTKGNPIRVNQKLIRSRARWQARAGSAERTFGCGHQSTVHDNALGAGRCQRHAAEAKSRVSGRVHCLVKLSVLSDLRPPGPRGFIAPLAIRVVYGLRNLRLRAVANVC